MIASRISDVEATGSRVAQSTVLSLSLPSERYEALALAAALLGSSPEALLSHSIELAIDDLVAVAIATAGGAA